MSIRGNGENMFRTGHVLNPGVIPTICSGRFWEGEFCSTTT